MARGAVPCRGPRRPGPPESLDRDRLLPRGPALYRGLLRPRRRARRDSNARTGRCDPRRPRGGPSCRRTAAEGDSEVAAGRDPAGGRAGRRCCGAGAWCRPGDELAASPLPEPPGASPALARAEPLVSPEAPRSALTAAWSSGRRPASLAQLRRPGAPGPSCSARPAAPPGPPPSPPLEVFLELERRMCLLPAPDSPRCLRLFPSFPRACS